MTALNDSNKLIRKRLKLQRAQLSKQQLTFAARELAKQFRLTKAQLNTTKVASYLSSNGEISPHEIINNSPASLIFLPRITNMSRASMAFYSSNNRLTRNRFNLIEPAAKGMPANIRHFDLILIPLVAFDRNGNRLGMGGGFYDRVLAFKNHNTSRTRPRLIGVAHHFQEVDHISPQPWDVRLDAILTDREFINVAI